MRDPRLRTACPAWLVSTSTRRRVRHCRRLLCSRPGRVASFHLVDEALAAFSVPVVSPMRAMFCASISGLVHESGSCRVGQARLLED